MRKHLARFLGIILLVLAVGVPWAWAETVFSPGNDSDNAIVIEGPGTWGDGAGYCQGQALVIRESGGDCSDTSGNGTLYYRIDALGNSGQNGGAHFACGLRESIPGATQCVWIQPTQDVHSLVVNRSATKDYLQLIDPSGEVVFKVANNGALQERREIVARDGQSTRVAIGNTFGVPGMCFGSTCDTSLARLATGVLGAGKAISFPEGTAPNPIANAAILFAVDNGSGKTVLKVQFPTGPALTLNTEP